MGWISTSLLLWFITDRFIDAVLVSFPSFTETFGQVVVEALASCLPVVGLDAEGTRDLVVDGRTGFLLRKPRDLATSEWSSILSSPESSTFQDCAISYARLLEDIIVDRRMQMNIRKRTRAEGTAGRTWFDAMNAMVDCYREGIAIAEQRSGMKRTPAHRRRFSLVSCPWAVALRVSAVCSIIAVVVFLVL